MRKHVNWAWEAKNSISPSIQYLLVYQPLTSITLKILACQYWPWLLLTNKNCEKSCFHPWIGLTSNIGRELTEEDKLNNDIIQKLKLFLAQKGHIYDPIKMAQYQFLTRGQCQNCKIVKFFNQTENDFFMLLRFLLRTGYDCLRT